jgi:hypothetical protein
MRRVSPGKAWLIVFSAPLVSAAAAVLCISALAVPAHADHCRKHLKEYTDVIVNAINAGVKPMCPQWKKALAAATALKELEQRKDCYHGRVSVIARNVEGFTKQETY